MADEATVDTTVTTPTQGTPTPATSSPSPSADHSTAQPASAEPSGEPRESLLDAVQQAVPPRTSQYDGADAGQGVSPAPTARTDHGITDDDQSDEVTADEMARYHPSAKKRVDKLINERRQLRAEVSRLRTLEPSATAADNVTNYLRQNDIGRDDFLLTLDLAAAMRRGDFRTFYEGVMPYVKLAEEYLGVSLPPDLQQRVREGHMTTQAAAAFSRERMDRALAQNQRTREQQQSQAQQHHFATEQLANSVAASVNTWETQVMQRDPDYAAKRTAVQNMMWSVVRERGRPRSAEQAVGIAGEAYRRVNELHRSWTAPRRPTSRSPSSTGRTTGAAPEAKSLMDVVRQARESARA